MVLAVVRSILCRTTNKTLHVLYQLKILNHTFHYTVIFLIQRISFLIGQSYEQVQVLNGNVQTLLKNLLLFSRLEAALHLTGLWLLSSTKRR